MKVSLDAYVTFLDEVLRGHEAVCQALPLAGDGAGSGGRSSVGGKEAATVATAGGRALPSLAEGALTELLRFQVVLQAQQTSPRKVIFALSSRAYALPVLVYPLGPPSRFLFFVSVSDFLNEVLIFSWLTPRCRTDRGRSTAEDTFSLAVARPAGAVEWVWHP